MPLDIYDDYSLALRRMELAFNEYRYVKGTRSNDAIRKANIELL